MADTKVDTKPVTETEVETTPERKQKRSPKATKDSEALNAAVVEKEFHAFLSKLQSKYPSNMLAYQVSNLSEVSLDNQYYSSNVEYIFYDMK